MILYSNKNSCIGEIPKCGVLLIVVENAVSGAAPESPISVELG
jgi:hypothetical protein